MSVLRCEWPGWGRTGSSKPCLLRAGHPGDHWYGKCDRDPLCRFRMLHDGNCWTGPKA